jgi:positive regulator of sigma E activity
MKETAKIVKIQREEITLCFTEHEGCKECSSSFCSIKEKLFTAANPRGLALEEGMLVRVFLEPKRTIAFSSLVLVVPLLLFVLFYIASQRLLGLDSEIFEIGIGVCGLALGFLISYMVMKRHRESATPVIEEIVV